MGCDDPSGAWGHPFEYGDTPSVRDELPTPTAVPEFDVEVLEALTWSLVGPGADGFIVISSEIVDETRWALVKRLVFGYAGRFFAMTYRSAATEMQEEDFDPEVVEVFPVEKTVTVYEPAAATAPLGPGTAVTNPITEWTY